MLLQENVALAPLTTIKVGGAARYLVEAKTVGEVQEAVTFAQPRNLPLFVLGGGSNLVVADAGWPGMMLKVSIPGIEKRSASEDGKIVFDVGAGESWDRFVWHAVMAQGGGVECLSGIPGSVGGTPVQNVGAYGQEVADTIESVQVFDLQNLQVRDLCNEACGFSYRTSIFNTTERGRFVILRVTYALNPGAAPNISYADLKRHFEGRDYTPSLAETREAVRHIRAIKGMLIVPGEPDCKSAGSFFKNPVDPAQLSRPGKEQEGFRGVAGRALRFRQGIRIRTRRHFEQTCTGHRQPRRSHSSRSARPERPNPATRRGNLGHSPGTGTSHCEFLVLLVWGGHSLRLRSGQALSAKRRLQIKCKGSSQSLVLKALRTGWLKQTKACPERSRRECRPHTNRSRRRRPGSWPVF